MDANAPDRTSTTKGESVMSDEALVWPSEDPNDEARRRVLRVRDEAAAALARPDASAAPLAPGGGIGALGEVEQMRAMLARPRVTGLRRLAFIWFRIYSRELYADGRRERVNIRIPIPLIGGLLPRRPTTHQALDAMRAIAEAGPDADPIIALGEYMDSTMALELIRSDESKPARGKRELVVIGFD